MDVPWFQRYHLVCINDSTEAMTLSSDGNMLWYNITYMNNHYCSMSEVWLKVYMKSPELGFLSSANTIKMYPFHESVTNGRRVS